MATALAADHAVFVKSVLIVDDHAMFRQALSLALNEYDNLVVPFLAGSGEEALAMLVSAKPDVVLMDISMPGMNGLDLAEAVCTLHPETRVLLISGHMVLDSSTETALCNLSPSSTMTRPPIPNRPLAPMTATIYSNNLSRI